MDIFSSDVTLWMAISAGILSFLSPCVLPLIPGYLAYISGSSLKETKKKKIVFNSFFFVLGFTVVFVSLGATASFVGKFLIQYRDTLRIIGGIIIIVFGLHTLGIIRISKLYSTKRVNYGNGRGPLGAFLLGIAFSFGWTPCIGPILGSILIYASSQATMAKGMGLLFAYSMGLGIPFMLSSILIDTVIEHLKGKARTIEILSGSLLIAVGIAMVFNLLSYIA
ncbi:MAG: cytochrome c biogenesis CcdA family protein [Candidatus Methanofastidiosia archaeon]